MGLALARPGAEAGTPTRLWSARGRLEDSIMLSLSSPCAHLVSLFALAAVVPAQVPTMLRDLNTTPREVPAE